MLRILLALVGSLVVTLSVSAADRKNVLFIVADDLGK